VRGISQRKMLRWRNAILPLLALALALLVVVVALPTTAVASPDWSTPVNISDSPGASQQPAIAIDSDGTTHVVWQDNTPGTYEIFYAFKPLDGSWSAPVNISANDTIASQYPDIAIDSDDNLHVVWQDETALAITDIYYINKTPGGPWSSEVDISNNAGASRWPAIAIDNDDNLHVVWHDQTPGIYEIYYSFSLDGGLTWSPPDSISDGPSSYAAAIAIDSEDNIHVAWQQYITSGNHEIYYVTKPSGESWSTPVNISDNSEDSLYPAIATDNSDNIHVVWEDLTPGNLEILYVAKPSDGSWSTPVNISNNDGSSVFPDIATDSNNGLHVVWSDWTPGNLTIYYASKPSGGSWSTPESISNDEDDSNTPAIAIDNNSRNLRVVWAEQFELTRWEIMYASAPLPQEAAEGGIPWGTIAGAVVGGVAVAAGIYFFVIRKWLKPRQG
jgi:hypothetical protein